MKKIIGLTGMSGSGKSTVASVFSSLGAVIIDCDKIAHKALFDNNVKKRLVSFFGTDIIDNEGEIIRKTLASKAFASKDSTEKLNSVTHPYILEQVRKHIAECDGTCVIDAPLLFDCGLDSICDVTVAVTAEYETLLTRISQRDGITREEAKKRLSAQADMPQKLKNADVLIENNGISEDALKELAENIYKIIINNDKQ